MANFFEFNGFRPSVHPSAYVHPNASVIGNVTIGKDVYIGPGAALRGDWGEIIVEDGCNVQESCTLHMFPGEKVHLMEGAHIGHGAIVHGATVGCHVLIGMNAVIMDQVVIGEHAIIGALSFVKEGTLVEARSLYAGNPARMIKELSEEMMKWKDEGTKLYRGLPQTCHETMIPCDPLDYVPKFKAAQQAYYQSWTKHRKQP
ncbi:MAG: transferase hexapeptide repeat family protein [Flavobacteriales bacterium]|nr:transferase hexapeptide repeat family protein [Flavobacteriales bacterium]MCB9449324.1 transferase hexapeptide repeat family protein [Flavobacteriales bacterium]